MGKFYFQCLGGLGGGKLLYCIYCCVVCFKKYKNIRVLLYII